MEWNLKDLNDLDNSSYLNLLLVELSTMELTMKLFTATFDNQKENFHLDLFNSKKFYHFLKRKMGTLQISKDWRMELSTQM